MYLIFRSHSRTLHLLHQPHLAAFPFTPRNMGESLWVAGGRRVVLFEDNWVMIMKVLPFLVALDGPASMSGVHCTMASGPPSYTRAQR